MYPTQPHTHLHLALQLDGLLCKSRCLLRHRHDVRAALAACPRRRLCQLGRQRSTRVAQIVTLDSIRCGQLQCVPHHQLKRSVRQICCCQPLRQARLHGKFDTRLVLTTGECT